MILDTETNLEKLGFDFGWLTIDKNTLEVLSADSFLSAENFHDVWYKKNEERYLNYIDNNKVYVKSSEFIVAYLAWAVSQVDEVWAYNAQFDKRVLEKLALQVNHMQAFRIFSKAKWCDLWHGATETICRENGYKAYTHENNFISDKGNIRTSAEVVYGYLKQDAEFEEEHTALADCLIEFEIYKEIQKRSKHMNYPIVNMPWLNCQDYSTIKKTNFLKLWAKR